MDMDIGNGTVVEPVTADVVPLMEVCLLAGAGAFARLGRGRPEQSLAVRRDEPEFTMPAFRDRVAFTDELFPKLSQFTRAECCTNALVSWCWRKLFDLAELSFEVLWKVAVQPERVDPGQDIGQRL